MAQGSLIWSGGPYGLEGVTEIQVVVEGSTIHLRVYAKNRLVVRSDAPLWDAGVAPVGDTFVTGAPKKKEQPIVAEREPEVIVRGPRRR